ncbi:hypothetical protein [Halococcus salifodinae]|uniref:hypothetical protein n=1 Tax=Halococcus salifodinae TaxID=36738 RepID=UPI000AAF2C85|nr:hypothetical protein [Halococcus salifodinae]
MDDVADEEMVLKVRPEHGSCGDVPTATHRPSVAATIRSLRLGCRFHLPSTVRVTG